MESNLTTNLSSAPDNSTATRPFSTSFQIWSGVFFVVLALNFIGNILVVGLITAERKFHSTMNYLFVNMAFSDFLAGVFSLLWYIANYVAPKWKSDWVCRVVAANSITVLSGLVSIFTLTAITLERYHAILKPLEHRMSWSRFRIILLVIWSLSIIFSLPYFIFIQFVEGDSSKICIFLLGKWQRQLLTTLMFSFMYVCPNIIICVAYVKIVKYLWCNEENNEMKESHKALLRSRKKITKLLGSVLILFNLCTFPNFIGDFMLSFGAIGYGHWFPQIVFLIQLVSTCVNPLIFFVQSNQFRKRLLEAICCRLKAIERWSTFRGTGTSTKSQLLSINRHVRTTL
ncbi:substance-P receptor-like [Dendronephthya gigantea]|uniref:substance-P receptor-like n=1 Tax=Dendronephthya gigantea TaxID=151771 RepID=UPI00106C6494|nr:substance-P receptor-like [Dendronephthya gigantea]